jgi:serine protease inhibitor
MTQGAKFKMSDETKCEFCNQDYRNCVCSSGEEKDYDVIVDMLQKHGYNYEGTQIDDYIIELELWKDDITEFMIIPKERINMFEQYYNILSFSPQLKTIEGETFASLVIRMEWKNQNE